MGVNMPEDKNGIPLRFKNRVYIICPDFRFVHEIEDELGGIPALQERMSQKDWKISELVALIHMMLQTAGETVDYLLLGNLMLKEGLDRYLAAARSFLQLVLHAQ